MTVECEWEHKVVSVACSAGVRSVFVRLFVCLFVCLFVYLFVNGYREDDLLISVCIMLLFIAQNIIQENILHRTWCSPSHPGVVHT